MPARSPLTGRFIFVLQGSKGPTKKKWQWTTQRRIMLLTQVSTTGVNAFLTSRDVPGQSQVEVWGACESVWAPIRQGWRQRMQR